MNYKRRRPPAFVFIFIAAIALLAIGGLVMLLWNAILPDLLNTKRISYWQAVGLLVLTKILLSPFRPGGGPKKHFGPGERLREKFKQMTPEERQQFRKQWRERFRNDWRNHCTPGNEAGNE
ncbi:hypothetical protein A8C56_19545 [Niabella ginsenosidivorans]|uniref:Uncharacterized protein n=1 Tax=Niabella ginsenosidivorans TaxID=1176587 RepID=A0A1A9I757_9BACT|nr:hypothetical protein [Niabella ginsenosidivorans]ANH82889.1 hypothetical protein A8C56_19545 [Niabella ginsenosidivorans]